jgi:hypothetical protein
MFDVITDETLELVVLNFMWRYIWSRDISVGIATAYVLDGRCSILGNGKILFSNSQCSDRLLGPPSLTFNGYRGLLPPR